MARWKWVRRLQYSDEGKVPGELLVIWDREKPPMAIPLKAQNAEVRLRRCGQPDHVIDIRAGERKVVYWTEDGEIKISYK